MVEANILIPHMQAVATHFWGVPNKGLSSARELRWGNHGSKKVTLESGLWYDQEEKIGGGVIDLVAKETGRKGPEAIKWLNENGFTVDGFDERAAAPVKKERAQSKPVASVKAAPATEKPAVAPSMKIVKTWDYVDEEGALLFQVCRLEGTDEDGQPGKTYRQRMKGEDDQWQWAVKGVRQVPYRLPELIRAVEAGKTIFIVEGEKCADALWKYDRPATCNAGGAGKFPDALITFFQGADVVILPDDDPQSRHKLTKALMFHEDGRPKFTGRDHARLVSKQLHGTAASIKVLRLYDDQKKKDVADWLLVPENTEGALDALVAKAPLWTPDDDFITKFRALPWAHLDDKGPEHEWLIKGLLTRYERSLLAGASMSGKSFFALDLGLAIARGIEFFGMKCLHGGVVYQAGEGGSGIKKRLRAYRIANGLKLDVNLPFVLLPKPIDIHGDDKDTDLMIDEILHWSRTFTVPLELTVIDTLSAATPGANENRSEDMSLVLARCTRIAEATKSHVMLVHHMNAEGGKPRGHTSIFANLENVLTLYMIDGLHDASDQRRQIREAVVTKQKDEEEGRRIRFVLRRVVVGTDKDGDEVSSCVVERPNEGAMAGVNTKADPKIRLADRTATLLKSINFALDEHGEPPPLSLQLPPHMRVVKWEHVRERFKAETFAGDDETDPEKKAAKIRQAAIRAGDDLLAHGIIGKNKDYVWRTGKPVAGIRTPRGKTVEQDEIGFAPLLPMNLERERDDDLPL